MANVMGYLYFRINLFMSWHFHDWRHVVLAVEDSTAGQIRAEHQLEVACRCRQPVGLVPGGSRALQINIDGAIGVRHEAGARADAGAIDGVADHVPDHIGHGQRPEGIVGRKLSCRKMQDVSALAGEPPPRAVDGRRPVGRLLHHIDGWPDLKVVLHPLTVVVMAFTTAFIMICAVRNASTPPTMIACTTGVTESMGEKHPFM